MRSDNFTGQVLHLDLVACRRYGVETMNIAVVGAGLAGLAVALGCEQAGHDVTLFEASSEVGGRMKTLVHDNHAIDVGFHVLHTAYPTVQRWVNFEQLHAKPMDNCTVTIDPSTGRRRLLAMRFARRNTCFQPQIRWPSRRPSIFKWRLGTSSNDLERSMDAPSPSIAQGLSARRFRPSTKRVLKPLFAGITLDPSLSGAFCFRRLHLGCNVPRHDGGSQRRHSSRTQSVVQSP